MHDRLAPASRVRQVLLATHAQVCEAWGLDPVETPVVEERALFQSALDETGEVVSKQMYGVSGAPETGVAPATTKLVLRPEGTAGVVRALAMVHGASWTALGHSTPRLYYQGPMFRHERPQLGRERQFTQVGVEITADLSHTPDPHPTLEIETIELAWRYLEACGVTQHCVVEINTLGTPDCRARHQAQLLAWLAARGAPHSLSPTGAEAFLSRRVLQLMDSKMPEDRALLDASDCPTLLDSVSPEERTRFDAVRAGLEQVGVPTAWTPQLARGLDYYGGVIFEVTTQVLGAQTAVLGGGRYDALLPRLGCPAGVSAMGWAAGVERLHLLVDKAAPLRERLPAQVVVGVLGAGGEQRDLAMHVASVFRQARCRTLIAPFGASLRAVKKFARRSGRWLMVVGTDEVARGEVALTPVGDTGEAVAIKLPFALRDALHLTKTRLADPD